MKRALLIPLSSLLVVLALFGFSYNPVHAQSVVCSTPTSITTTHAEQHPQFGFATGDEYIVWINYAVQDSENLSQVYAYNLRTGEILKIGQPGRIATLDVNENDIVWEAENDVWSYNVYYHDLETGVTSTLLTSIPVFYTRVEENVIAWERWFPNELDNELLIFNLKSHAVQRVTDNDLAERVIGIDSNRVAYFTSDGIVHLYDLTTGEATSRHIDGFHMEWLNPNYDKFLSGNYLAFNDTEINAVKIFDLSSNTLRHTIESAVIGSFDGTHVVYEQIDQPGRLFVYNLVTHETFQISSGERLNRWSIVDGDHLIWQSDAFGYSDQRVFYYNLRLKSLIVVSDGNSEIHTGVLWQKPFILWMENSPIQGSVELMISNCHESIPNTSTPTATNIPLTATIAPSTPTDVPATATETATIVPATDTPPPATVTPSEVTETAVPVTITSTATTPTLEATLTDVPATSTVATTEATNTATEQPTVVTSTPTIEPVLHLLSNDGFEESAFGWKLTSASQDKVKCNKAGKPPVTTMGKCAFVFKGSIGEQSKLSQSVSLNDATVGDTLDFSLWVKATNSAASGKIKVRVKYGDSTPTGKIDLTITPNGDYTELTGNHEITSANVSKIKVQIDHTSAAGKVFVDDVSLIYSEAHAGLLPLP
jgi:hypothetical protein